MKLNVLPRLIGVLGCLATVSGHAQQATPPVADTVGYERGYGRLNNIFYQGDLRLADGTVLRVYLPTTQIGFEKTVDYFASPPLPQSKAKRITLKVSDVYSMQVHGRYYETMQLGLKTASILALQVQDGPVELFAYAEPRAVPVPVAGMSGAMGAHILPVGTYTDNHWFVRRQGTLTEVRRGFFTEQMSEYLNEFPEMAQKIATDTKNYRYRDMPTIVAEFNQYLAAARK